MKMTPSQVKNLMLRGLRLLVDPEPKLQERQRVIAFFEHCCAYCGGFIEDDKGDLDHLLPAAQGGRNHISNRVFSCKPCNAKEKRDKDWKVFLLEKHGRSPSMEQRRHKILEWVESAGEVPPLSESTLHIIEEQSRKVTEAYDDACRKVRGV